MVLLEHVVWKSVARVAQAAKVTVGEKGDSASSKARSPGHIVDMGVEESVGEYASFVRTWIYARQQV